MIQIEIDQDVLGFLERAARPFAEPTPNHVLRRLLLQEDDEPRGTSDPASRKGPRGSRATRSSAAFMRSFLKEHFEGPFRAVSPYRTMFESERQIVYFQNFNKADSPNLWYRLKGTATKRLVETRKDGFVCFTNPAEGIAYVLPLDQLVTKAGVRDTEAYDDLEVNIDHANGRWRELDWGIEPFLTHLAGASA
jgi:hypothetical protein